MNIANSISDLFVRWRSAHNEESNDSLIITKESNISKDSFCEDGLIDDECENVDVLYILKESHIGKRSEKTLIRCKNEFWLKKVYNEKYSYKKIPRRLKKAQEVIFNSNK